MTTTMDIVVCLDCASSMVDYLEPIRRSIVAILKEALACHESDVRMALIQFQSHSDDLWIIPNPFTTSMDTFKQLIDTVQTEGRIVDENKAIVDALSESLTLHWRSDDIQARRCHEKLVILVTDGPPCGLFNEVCRCNSRDLWRVSDEFKENNITLVVIGVEPNIVACDDFYCALAVKTGGEYIPFTNAQHVLCSVIPRVILEEKTLSRLLHCFDIAVDIKYNCLYYYSYDKDRARSMMERCETMADIRKWLYNHNPKENFPPLLPIPPSLPLSIPPSPLSIPPSSLPMLPPSFSSMLMALVALAIGFFIGLCYNR